MRPDHLSLTPDKRRREIARLLAGDVLRLQARGLLPAAPDPNPGPKNP